jgi:muramoyltetrapeptide carboxypeptidase
MSLGTGGIAAPAVGASPRKAPSLDAGCIVKPFAPASPADATRIAAGLAELRRLGFRVDTPAPIVSEGYFAGSVAHRLEDFVAGMQRPDIDALFAVRGGYGSNYLLEHLTIPEAQKPKIILGFSDLTSLQIFLWQRHRWVTFYGPMIAAGFDAGAGSPKGYDERSLLAALRRTEGPWEIDLNGEMVVAGETEGWLLGGCMTLVETTLGTPWELDTRNAILLLEDRGMKPWQVDRALMHLKQAGKFEQVRGVMLGDFPDCEPPVPGSATVREVCSRILGELDIPVVFGAAVGHTMRPMLTIPLGVKARLSASSAGKLEILEPAVA